MTSKRCEHCGQAFEAVPQVPGQTYCSAAGCQRARKSQWQKVKLQTDPDYRDSQRTAQKSWASRNKDYWARYKLSQVGEKDFTKTAATKSQKRDTSANQPTKMDVSRISDGIYHIKLIIDLKERHKQTYIAQLTLLNRNE